MNKNKNLSKEQQRELLELECRVARLKIETSRYKNQLAKSPITQHQSPVFRWVESAQSAKLRNPFWRFAMLYLTGRKKWYVGAALMAWQIWSDNQRHNRRF